MTWDHLKWASKQTVGCAFAKAVLKEIAMLAKPSGECVIAVNELVERLELSERTIRKALTKLVADGHLLRQRRTNGRGFRAADQYTILGAPQTARPTGTGDRLAKRSNRPLGLPAQETGPLTYKSFPREDKPILGRVEEDTEAEWGSPWWSAPPSTLLCDDDGDGDDAVWQAMADDDEVPA